MSLRSGSGPGPVRSRSGPVPVGPVPVDPVPVGPPLMKDKKGFVDDDCLILHRIFLPPPLGLVFSSCSH